MNAETTMTEAEMIEALDTLTVDEITQAAYPDLDPEGEAYAGALAKVWDLLYDYV